MTNTIEMKQTPYNDILDCSSSHLGFTLALDVSGSMAGSKLQTLIDGVEKFKSNSSDPSILNKVDICIVTFGGKSEVKVIQDWMPLANFVKQPPLDLTAAGNTPLAQAITTSLDLSMERKKLYNSIGTPSFTPMIMVITDAMPSSTTDEMMAAKERLRALEDQKKVRAFACGIGIQDTDMDTLASITKRTLQCNDEQGLSALFDWITESVATISHSRTIIDGDSAQLPPLPQGLTVVPSDW